jgi:hypothetical protein
LTVGALSAKVVLMSDVETIRKKYEHYGRTEALKNNTAVLDIRILLEIIDQLKKET